MIKNDELRFEYEKMMEYMKWKKSLPGFHFKEKWNVRIVPPFCGAIIRFAISYIDKWVSVYFDAYDALGLVGQPYWEYYDGTDCHRYLLGDEEEMMREIEEYLES